ncbi:MAG: hypothetical protein VKL39_08360, partial [Leptolyngbyaceae bacterium]|nr:hypothetical protein [Leptolyngbyaceae bacterium]
WWGEAAARGSCPATAGGGHWLLLAVSALASSSNGRQERPCRISKVSVRASGQVGRSDREAWVLSGSAAEPGVNLPEADWHAAGLGFDW